MAIASRMVIVSTAAIAVHFTRVTSGGERDLLAKCRGISNIGQGNQLVSKTEDSGIEAEFPRNISTSVIDLLKL